MVWHMVDGVMIEKFLETPTSRFEVATCDVRELET
jgi:hypothetical protein